MLSKEDLQHFRRRLLALKRRLGDDLSALEEEALRGVGGEASGNLSNVPVHPADLGTDTFEEEVAIDLLGHEQSVLSEVNWALHRLDTGEFGRCENCGKEIARERLEALPYARHCIRCAEELQPRNASQSSGSSR